MGQDDPPNYDSATLVTVPLDGLEPLKHLAAFQARFSASATFADAGVGLAFVTAQVLPPLVAALAPTRGVASNGVPQALLLSADVSRPAWLALPSLSA